MSSDTGTTLRPPAATTPAGPDGPDGPPPLVVDLDGTLIHSDLLIESFFALLSASPLRALKALAALRAGKASLKASIADHAVLDLHTLPFNAEVLAFVEAERAKGRRVYLASASDQRFVAAVAAHLGCFDGAFGSTRDTNLSGARKAALLCREFGKGGFDYMGDARADLPVWDCCRIPIAVGRDGRLRRLVRGRYANCHEIPAPPAAGRDYLRALRVHQWLKNLLLLVPMLAGHVFTLEGMGIALLAMAAFSLCASSVYLLNDLVDLSHDRDHATKRHRPLAAGKVPVLHAALLIPLLLAASAGLGALVSADFLAILGLYYGTTLAYSLALKRKMVVDVLVLSILYTMRVLAGGIAVGVATSAWLMAFSIFIFLSLAIIKRYTELAGRARAGKGDPPGRDYQLADLPMLGGLGGASGYSAVTVLALYINSPEIHALYRAPQWLWLICLILLFWVTRALLLAHRGELHDDPVVFAATDRTSQVLAAVVAALVAVSI